MVALTVYPDEAPTIDSLTASTDPSTGQLMLTANGVDSSTSAVETVDFYVSETALPFASTDGSNGWSVDVPTAAPQTYYARAVDAGVQGPFVQVTVGSVAIGQLTASPQPYVANSTLTLTASDLLDLNNATIESVTFYQDLSGTGVYKADTVGPPITADGRIRQPSTRPAGPGCKHFSRSPRIPADRARRLR